MEHRELNVTAAQKTRPIPVKLTAQALQRCQPLKDGGQWGVMYE